LPEPIPPQIPMMALARFDNGDLGNDVTPQAGTAASLPRQHLFSQWRGRRVKRARLSSLETASWQRTAAGRDAANRLSGPWRGEYTGWRSIEPFLAKHETTRTRSHIKNRLGRA
jgi:hypothetical protein